MIEYGRIIKASDQDIKQEILIRKIDEHRITLTGAADPRFLVQALSTIVDLLNNYYAKGGREICVTIRTRD